jgi:hypothetical protein
MGHLFVLNRFIISLNNDPEYVEINSTQYTHAMPNMENIVTKSTHKHNYASKVTSERQTHTTQTAYALAGADAAAYFVFQ